MTTALEITYRYLHKLLSSTKKIFSVAWFLLKGAGVALFYVVAAGIILTASLAIFAAFFAAIAWVGVILSGISPILGKVYGVVWFLGFVLLFLVLGVN